MPCLAVGGVTLTSSGTWPSHSAEAGKGMPDYTYLLENRLSVDQQNALRQLREIARDSGLILFLTGDAVRDLNSGHAVRELEVSVHGNVLKLKKAIEKTGAQIWGEDPVSRTLYLCFPGSVRVDLVSTHRVEYPTPGKPVYHPASIHEDLRRRDFTVNAMALSLSEGSYGLLMDPLNGAADIESHTLRLVSNYGFLEEPSLLIRAVRFKTRLGWEMDPRTQTRYENAREEEVMKSLSEDARRRELEQICHEEEPLKILAALEEAGWMKTLFPAWTVAKADLEKLEALYALAQDLLAQGVHADKSAAQMQLLTAKMSAKDLAELKNSLLRPGFVEEWNNLDALAASFQKLLLAKESQAPSDAYKLFTSYDPESILWLGFTSKSAAVQEKFNLFLKVWPLERQKIPYVLMQEMRITPELPGYVQLAQEIFLQLIDGKLKTLEEMTAFLEPHSPPAPPPPVSIKRSRKRGEAKARRFEADEEEEDEREHILDDEDIDDLGAEDEDEEEEEPRVVVAKGTRDSASETGKSVKPGEQHGAGKAVEQAKSAPKAPAMPLPAAKEAPAPAAKREKGAPVKPAVPAKAPAKIPVKAEKPAAPAKAPTKVAKPVAKPAPAKAAAKSAPKTPAKPAAKSAAKPVVEKKAVAKPQAGKPPVKPTAKPVAPAKSVGKSAAKPVQKAAPTKSKATKPAPKSPAKPTAKSVAKPAKAAFKPVAKSAKVEAKKHAKVEVKKKSGKPEAKKSAKKR